MRPFFDDRGFTTAGTAVALLLVLALIAASMQAYQVQSRSAEVQSVADAAALAAEDEVSAFMTSVRICDAALLIMSIVGIGSYGIGTVCCCVPAAQAVGERLVSLGHRVLDARNDAAESMVKLLNVAQRALPATACAQAEAVISAQSSGDVTYSGWVELAPSTADDIEIEGVLDIEEELDDADAKVSDMEEQASTANEAMKEAEEAWERGYSADCGDAPGGCMYERAASLAGLSGDENPLLHSSGTWNFGIALQRARDYYEARIANEPQPEAWEGGDDWTQSWVDEQVRRALRLRVYGYAREMLEDAYVDTADGVMVAAELPTLPKSDVELRGTDLYTNESYPVTEDDMGQSIMHAWYGCPGAEGRSILSYGSIEQLEGGEYGSCPVCGMSIGKVAQVSNAPSSIDNGFEYYYRKVSEAAQDYLEARGTADPALQEAKQAAESIFETLGSLLGEALKCRIEAYPPGRYGAVALVRAEWESEAGLGGFVQDVDLGQGAAISAAALVDDEEENVISAAFDQIEQVTGLDDLVAGDSVVGGILGSVVEGYGDGADALGDAIEDALDAIPLASASGLGTWARDQFDGILEDAGLAPTSTAMPKPVVINTDHVEDYDDSGILTRILGRIREGEEWISP